MITRYSFDDGRYEVFRNNLTYEVTIYLDGEYWEVGKIDVSSYRMFHAILNEIERLREYLKVCKEIRDDCKICTDKWEGL